MITAKLKADLAEKVSEVRAVESKHSSIIEAGRGREKYKMLVDKELAPLLEEMKKEANELYRTNYVSDEKVRDTYITSKDIAFAILY